MLVCFCCVYVCSGCNHSRGSNLHHSADIGSIRWFSGKEHKKGPMAYLLIHTIEIYCNVPSKC